MERRKRIVGAVLDGHIWVWPMRRLWSVWMFAHAGLIPPVWFNFICQSIKANEADSGGPFPARPFPISWPIKFKHPPISRKFKQWPDPAGILVFYQSC